LITDKQRRAYLKKLAAEEALALAVTNYSQALVAQLKTADAAGAWPEKITFNEPTTPAETEALALVLGHLRKQLPTTEIVLTT
jgi:hypothetical protein